MKGARANMGRVARLLGWRHIKSFVDVPSGCLVHNPGRAEQTRCSLARAERILSLSYNVVLWKFSGERCREERSGLGRGRGERGKKTLLFIRNESIACPLADMYVHSR